MAIVGGRADVPDRARPAAIGWGALRRHRELVSAVAFFVLMLSAFTIANPDVFLHIQIYKAVAVSLPVSIILAVALVFVVAAGEIDLSFPSIVGIAALVFTEVVQAGFLSYVGLVLALLAGAGAGLVNGVLVTYVGLSSLVATLGMNFLWRGLIQIITEGTGAPLEKIRGTGFYNLFVGELGEVPVQMLWGRGFAGIAILLFTRHKFGARIAC